MINYDRVEELDQWLDDNASSIYQRQPQAQDWARISKVAEELGEAIQAFIGYTGQNPRKGTTHSKADVLKELADTIATGILAIQHFTKDKELTQVWVEQHLDYLHKRVLGDQK